MSEMVPVDPFDLIIFGATGDLAMRKLVPALYHRDADGQFPEGSRIVGVSLSELDAETFRERVLEALKTHLAPGEFTQERWAAYRERLDYVRVDAVDMESWRGLKDRLGDDAARSRVSYLATPPSLFGPIAQGLRDAGLITGNSRIVLEKPLGHDFDSAKVINDAVGECFEEHQIFRIDHYLGKETVQNLLALRFGNFMFEPLWGRDAIDHVQITVAEELGVGGRIGFYDRVGAMRDMVQNHMFQLLCLVAMEPPASLHHDAVRDEKVKVLEGLRPIPAERMRDFTVRAQYRAGAMNGEAVPGYMEELASAAPETTASDTETFCAMKLYVDNWRWSKVPFYLRTGKRLPLKHSEIVVQYKDVPHSIFPQQQGLLPNRLLIRLQPDEGVKLEVMVKQPGPGGFLLQPVSLDLSFNQTFTQRYHDAYERLLMEVLRGNPALFMRRDEIEAAWRFIDSIREGWRSNGQRMESYVAGSWGPTASSMLMDRDGRTWHPDH